MKLRLILILFLITACTQRHDENHLKKSSTPLLKAQSKHSIWWYPWESQALDYAQKNNKLIFLSVSYSSCHWCTKMDTDVFAHEDVSKALNKDFVSIKVDREERLDLDSYFIKAQTFINQKNGWPITMVLTPDLKPIFAAVYIPKKELIYILNELQTAWKQQTEKLVERGNNVHKLLQKKPTAEISLEKNYELIKKFYAQYTHIFDPIFGGRKVGRQFQPKFPINNDVRLLLRYYLQTKEKQAFKMANLTLKTNSKSALFDHIEGGFHRFSLDRRWNTPHFEKMLYDQATFIEALVDLYRTKNDSLTQQTVEKTIQFLFKSLQSPQGGFYSSVSSSINGQDGRYYTWQDHEIKSSLTSTEQKAFNDIFSLAPKNKNLQLRRTLNRKSSFVKTETNQVIDKLLKERQKRSKPIIDTKIITSWNGQILAALSKVARLWPSNEFNKIIEKNFSYLLDEHISFRGHLYSFSINGKAQNQGILDDYAFLIHALIEYYQTSFNEKYLLKAYDLQKIQDRLFWNSDDKTYKMSLSKEAFFKNHRVYAGSAYSSAQETSYWNLLRLSIYFQNKSLKEKADQLFSSYPDQLEKTPFLFSSLLLSLDFELANHKEFIMLGSTSDCLKSQHEIYQSFYPYILWSCFSDQSKIPLNQQKKKTSNKMTYYVCKDNKCEKPTDSYLQAKKSLFDN